MARSPLLGRRIHISGSIAKGLADASATDVEASREFVTLLVKDLVKRGANFVVPVDAEPVRADGSPICFDWQVWRALRENITLRPPGAPGPFVVAVQHHKTEEQIPPSCVDLWDGLRGTQLVQIESAAQWNMNSKRMESQARFGDILIGLGGDEGVLYLANLYHDAGKPVVPLPLPICAADRGARRLYDFGLASSQSRRLFQIENGGNSHDWLNRIRFPSRQPNSERVAVLIELLEALERPRAFAVRLLNPGHSAYNDVQDFFDVVARPVLEGELGYYLTVIDGKQAYEHSRIDQEIFAKLHRSSVVIADLTGSRPNCFLELGYALGRGLPTMVTVRDGEDLPFDIKTFSGLQWKANGSAEERKQAFREHWNAIRNRPPLVPTEPLIS